MSESCVTWAARLPSAAVTQTFAPPAVRWMTASLVPSGDHAWARSRPAVKRVTGTGAPFPSSWRWTFQAGSSRLRKVSPFPSGLHAGSMALAGSRNVASGAAPGTANAVQTVR